MVPLGTRTRPWLALATLILGLHLASCGGGQASDPFALCGNGRIDPGEQCDDGNLRDDDDCLSTCVLASCSDPFGTCSGSDLRGKTCANFSRVDVTGLACKQNCRLDLSGCGATFTPVPTATATPTPTPPPPPACGDGLLDHGERCAGGTGCDGDTGVTSDKTTPCCPDGDILASGEYCTVCSLDCEVQSTPGPTVPPGPTVTVSFAAPSGSVTTLTVLIGYRVAVVSLPGSGATSSVAARIKNKPSSDTFVTANDLDYALRVQLTRSNPLAPGRLFTIGFDAAGDTALTAADFSCTVEICKSSDGEVPGCTCTVSVPGGAVTPTATPTATATPG